MSQDPFNTMARLWFAVIGIVLLYEAVVTTLANLIRAIFGPLQATRPAPPAPHHVHSGTAGGHSVSTLLFGVLLLVGIAIAVHLGVFRWARHWYHTHVRPPQPSPRGARFASIWELWRARLLSRQGWPIGTVHRRFRPRVVVRLSLDRERAGVLVVGSPGAGKSVGIAATAILSEIFRTVRDRRSLVIGDPKDELSPWTIRALSTTHHVLVWHLSDPNACTVTFEPLVTLPRPDDPRFLDEVRRLAHGWFWATRQGVHATDPFFITQPLALMEAVFLAFLDRSREGTFLELGDWIRTLTYGEFAEVLQRSTAPHVRAYGGQVRSLALADKAMGGIWADIQQRFAILDSPNVRAAMGAGRQVNWRDFDHEPTALFLRISLRDTDRLQPLLSLFLARMYACLTDLGSQYPGNRLPREVRVVCDEFGNLGRVYGIEKVLATLRGYGVGHVLFVQTRAQLRAIYGYDEAATIEGSLVTKIMLSGAEQEDARWMSQRCGDRTQYISTGQYGDGGLFRRAHVSRGHAPDTRPLITADEIIHSAREVFVSTSQVRPLRLALRPFFEVPAMRRLVAEEHVPLWTPDPDEAAVAVEAATTLPAPETYVCACTVRMEGPAGTTRRSYRDFRRATDAVHAHLWEALQRASCAVQSGGPFPGDTRLIVEYAGSPIVAVTHTEDGVGVDSGQGEWLVEGTGDKVTAILTDVFTAIGKVHGLADDNEASA